MNTKPDTDTDTAGSAEQKADFAALQASAADAPPVPGAEGDAPPRQDLAAELAGLASIALVTLGPIFPSLGEIYTPPVLEAASAAIARVLDKHGWMQGGMFGEWGEEIACIAIVGPLALATVAGIKADNAKRRPPPKKTQLGQGLDLEAATQATGAGAATMTMGAMQP